MKFNTGKFNTAKFNTVKFNIRVLSPVSMVFLLAASLPATAQEPVQRSITPLAGNVYRAQNNIHHTVFQVTPEGILLADPINREFSTWLKAELDQRFGVPVRYVLYSHHHWDHASGGAVFADTARFVGQENMLAHLAMPPSDTPLPAPAAGMDGNGNGRIEASEASGNHKANFALFDGDGDGALSGAEVARGALGDVRAPDITYHDRAAVSLGGSRVELTWTGPMTHTDDMSVIRFADAGVVFVVDFISIKTMPYRTMGTQLLDEWLESIRAVETMDFEILSPGHGLVGGKADVAEHRQYLETLRDAVSAGIKAGHTVEELQESVKLEQYSAWFMYDAWRAENVAGMYQLLVDQQ